MSGNHVHEDFLVLITNLQFQFPDVKTVTTSPSAHFKPIFQDGSFTRVVAPIVDLDKFVYKSKAPPLFYGPFLVEVNRVKGIYFGGISEGRQDGPGILLYQNGSSYQGNWQRGVLHGKGRYIHEDGTTYEGEWEMSVAKGYGKYYLDGGVSEGFWENNDKNGPGEETWLDGNSYKGNYLNGMKDGKGVFQWSN